MKDILIYWSVMTSLVLGLVLILKLPSSPCATTDVEIRSAEIACDGEIKYWMDSYNSVYSNFKLCSVELNSALGLNTNP